MSATLTLTELVIERICDTIDNFPPLFARLCQVPGIVPGLIGGRVFKVVVVVVVVVWFCFRFVLC
jgi:hypothetical protein